MTHRQHVPTLVVLGDVQQKNHLRLHSDLWGVQGVALPSFLLFEDWATEAYRRLLMSEGVEP
jgi:hypothetical protein